MRDPRTRKNRDTAAMHIEIDKVIRVTGKARNVLPKPPPGAKAGKP